MQEKSWYSEKWVGRQAAFSPSRYVKKYTRHLFVACSASRCRGDYWAQKCSRKKSLNVCLASRSQLKPIKCTYEGVALDIKMKYVYGLWLPPPPRARYWVEQQILKFSWLLALAPPGGHKRRVFCRKMPGIMTFYDPIWVNCETVFFLSPFIFKSHTS